MHFWRILLFFVLNTYYNTYRRYWGIFINFFKNFENSKIFKTSFEKRPRNAPTKHTYSHLYASRYSQWFDGICLAVPPALLSSPTWPKWASISAQNYLDQGPHFQQFRWETLEKRSMVSLFMGRHIASTLAKRVHQRTVSFLVGAQCPYIAPISAQNHPDFFVSDCRYFLI